MTHGLSSNISCLKRWAQHNPELPMPEDWSTFSKTNPEDAIRMRVKDPELVSLLNNNATAQLKAEDLSSHFPDVETKEQLKAGAQRRARVQEIFDQKPFGGMRKQ